jgi:hypothetical protein
MEVQHTVYKNMIKFVENDLPGAQEKKEFIKNY